MKSLALLPTHTLLLSMALGLAACGGAKPEAAAAQGDGPAAETAEPVKGPHGGRLLREGAFALEVRIFETGVPPEFRLYPTEAGKPLPPQDVQVTLSLHRLNGLPGGVRDTHRFAPKDDYLASPAEVYEPHSYAVTVQARHAGRDYRWQYDSPEGRVEIAADMAKAAGMKVAAAGEGLLHQTLSLYGVIQPDPALLRSVGARFPGPVRSVAVTVGDAVRKGQTLATIESNESLQQYAVTAPIAGTLTARHINPGESAGSEPLFEIADFSRVRAELSVFPRDRSQLRPGQPVRIRAADGIAEGEGSLGFIAPVGSAAQALSARVVLDNGQGQWTPGQFINAEVTVGSTAVPLAVPLRALQRFRDWDVVFVNAGEQYQALPVQLGRRDGAHVEIVGGLSPGAVIVVENSYLVKADIEKSGASHDH